jgi:hypothetical protein
MKIRTSGDGFPVARRWVGASTDPLRAQTQTLGGTAAARGLPAGVFLVKARAGRASEKATAWSASARRSFRGSRAAGKCQEGNATRTGSGRRRHRRGPLGNRRSPQDRWHLRKRSGRSNPSAPWTEAAGDGHGQTERSGSSGAAQRVHREEQGFEGERTPGARPAETMPGRSGREQAAEVVETTRAAPHRGMAPPVASTPGRRRWQRRSR